jgi:hypothetical protein
VFFHVTYDSAISEISGSWPHLQSPITFFFDHTENEEWRSAITRVHHSYKKIDARIKEVSFADKRDPEHYPLQAADMIAYRMRQIAGKFCNYDKNIPASLPPLDRILFGKLAGDEFDKLFPRRLR